MKITFGLDHTNSPELCRLDRSAENIVLDVCLARFDQMLRARQACPSDREYEEHSNLMDKLFVALLNGTDLDLRTGELISLIYSLNAAACDESRCSDERLVLKSLVNHLKGVLNVD